MSSQPEFLTVSGSKQEVPAQQHDSKTSLLTLTLGAIGVVYGDIGTSVLYAVKEVFGSGHVAFTHENIYGVLSILFWTLTVIVSLKYVVLILRADNNGEGGLVAMLALASQAVRHRPRLRQVLLAVGIFGTSLFFGDGVITPAISVLSAIEGLKVISPALDPFVIPLTLAVLFALFALQKHGTAGIGKFFGPITLAWFIAIAMLGASQIVTNPGILLALSPHHALRFIFQNPGTTFLILGAVVLCVTGAEALYADLGHFGKRPIRLAWFLVVMPALTLNYFGQGALLLINPEAVRNPFYMMMPEAIQIPMVALATMATVIASQALITGAFSVTKQVIQLGYLPRLRTEYTSARESGQIYIPFINWALFSAIALAVVLFESSSNLAGAYGIAVCIDMLITTTLTFFVIRYGWGYPLALCLAATGMFFIVDTAFLASNTLKLLDGGWFPLAIGASVFTLMMTWHDGRSILRGKLAATSVGLSDFLTSLFLQPPLRVEGTAVYLTAEVGKAPNAMLHNLKHNKVLHERNLFVTVVMHETPWFDQEQRVEVEPLREDCWRVFIHYGFKDEPDVPDALARLERYGCMVEPLTTSYFLSRESVVSTVGEGMATWREKLFSQMHRNAGSLADFMNLPSGSVVELGTKVEI